MYRNGYRLIAGIDEAGRGAFAGPLTVGLTIFSPQFFENNPPAELAKLNDSKALSEARRSELKIAIHSHALSRQVVHISNRLVDRMGINPATEFALERLVIRLKIAGIKPDILLMDGNYKFTNFRLRHPEIEYRAVVKGDSTVFSIAAASILAKQNRDERMKRFSSSFPKYDFATHKGYGTEQHRNLITEHGPSPLHRKSYLRKLLNEKLLPF